MRDLRHSCRCRFNNYPLAHTAFMNALQTLELVPGAVGAFIDEMPMLSSAHVRPYVVASLLHRGAVKHYEILAAITPHCRMDDIKDFNPAEDKIDLAQFQMLYSFGQLTFTQKNYGVLLTIGDDRFRIEGHDSQILQVADLTADNILFDF